MIYDSFTGRTTFVGPIDPSDLDNLKVEFMKWAEAHSDEPYNPYRWSINVEDLHRTIGHLDSRLI